MADNNKLIVAIAALIFAAIGVIVASLLTDVLLDQAASQTGVIKDFLDILTEPTLLNGIIWLIVCILLFYGVKQVVDEREDVGPISIFFLLIWLGVVIGLLIGNIAWSLIQGNTLTLDLDTIIAAMSLFTALGPSFAAALGIATK